MSGIESHEKGSITESKVLARLKELGYTVSIPWGRPRYDFVIEDDKELLKAQVKTGNLKNGTIVFECRSSHINSSGNKHMNYTEHEVDVYVVYSPDLDETYWVPFDEAPDTSMTIRVSDAKVDSDSINWSDEYRM